MQNRITANGFRLSICEFSSLPSTNSFLKKLAAEGAEEGTVVIAHRQTEGRGRMGRSFYSPPGTGLYMSVLLRPEISPRDALLITACAAVSAAEAVETVSGLNVGIKWVNDLFLTGKKVCGILAEGALSTDSNKFDYVILGLGINLFPPENGFPEEICNTASSVFPTGMNKADQEKILSDFFLLFLERFFAYYSDLIQKNYLEGYRSRSIVTGKEINIIRPEKEPVPAFVLGINDDFSLKVEFPDGRTENLSSGDISIRMR